MKKILIIIPAYNEQDSILEVVQSLKKHCPNFDYLVVNDCSKDQTSNILKKNKIKHIDLLCNLGLAGAVQTGYKYAYYRGYDYAIQFDGDGQHLAEYIEKLVSTAEKGYDIVIGSRFVKERKEISFRMIGSRIITLLIKIKTKVNITDPTSGMRLINRKMLEDYAFNMNRKPEPGTLVKQIKNGAKVKEEQVVMKERIGGQSIYSGITSSISYMLNEIFTIIFCV